MEDDSRLIDVAVPFGLLILVPDDGAPIHFAGFRYRDLAGSDSGGDFIVGKQLSRSVAGGKADLNLLPDWIEPLAGDRIDHGDERRPTRQPLTPLGDESH